MVVDMLPFLGAVLGGPGATVPEIEPRAAALVRDIRELTEQQHRVREIVTVRTGPTCRENARHSVQRVYLET